jgi:glycosyltransferase involved in cell wall biosynthesis
MSAAPRLSVVVPHYNHGQYVAGAIEAIVTQSTLPAEIAIVDDRSDSESWSVVEALAKRYPLVRLIRHDANRGVNASCHTGLAAVTGDYVLITAADDRMAPDHIARVSAALARHSGAGIVFSDNAMMSESGDDRTLFPLGIGDEARAFDPQQFRHFLGRSFFYVATCNVWFRTDALRRFGFDERLRWHADLFAAYAIGMSSGAIYVPNAVTYFRDVPTSYGAVGRGSALQVDVIRAWLEKTAEPTFWDQRAAFRDAAALPMYSWSAVRALAGDPAFLTRRLVGRLFVRAGWNRMRRFAPIGLRKWGRQVLSRRA